MKAIVRSVYQSEKEEKGQKIREYWVELELMLGGAPKHVNVPIEFVREELKGVVYPPIGSEVLLQLLPL